MNKKDFTQGPALYDEDQMMWYVKIGKSNKERTLLLTVWAKNEAEAKDFADRMVNRLCQPEPIGVN